MSDKKVDVRIGDLDGGLLLSYRFDRGSATFTLDGEVPLHPPPRQRTFARLLLTGARDLELHRPETLDRKHVLAEVFDDRSNLTVHVVRLDPDRLVLELTDLGSLSVRFDSYTIAHRTGHQLRGYLYADVSTGEPFDMYRPFDRLPQLPPLTAPQHEALANLRRTIADLRGEEAQREYKRAAPSVHVPLELLARWASHERLLRSPWFRDRASEGQLRAVRAFAHQVAGLRRQYEQDGGLPEDVPEILAVPRWRALMDSANTLLAILEPMLV